MHRKAYRRTGACSATAQTIGSIGVFDGAFAHNANCVHRTRIYKMTNLLASSTSVSRRGGIPPQFVPRRRASFYLNTRSQVGTELKAQGVAAFLPPNSCPAAAPHFI